MTALNNVHRPAASPEIKLRCGIDVQDTLLIHSSPMGQQLRVRVKRKARARRKKRLKERAKEKTSG
jgi:U3 small nucleolar ribonucleoprotein component